MGCREDGCDPKPPPVTTSWASLNDMPGPTDQTNSRERTSDCTDLGCLSTTYPFLIEAYLCITVRTSLSPTLLRRAHNIAWALRTYTMPHLPGPPLPSREAPARVRRPAHITRPRSVSGAILARIPTDPCTQAGGAALPVRVTRKPCLPYHSGRRKETSEDGAHMPLLLSSMALPFRREQPELIGAPRQKLFRSDGCSSDRIAPSWCQVAGLPVTYRARRISRGQPGNPELLRQYEFGTCRQET